MAAKIMLLRPIERRNSYQGLIFLKYNKADLNLSLEKVKTIEHAACTNSQLIRFCQPPLPRDMLTTAQIYALLGQTRD